MHIIAPSLMVVSLAAVSLITVLSLVVLCSPRHAATAKETKKGSKKKKAKGKRAKKGRAKKAKRAKPQEAKNAPPSQKKLGKRPMTAEQLVAYYEVRQPDRMNHDSDNAAVQLCSLGCGVAFLEASITVYPLSSPAPRLITSSPPHLDQQKANAPVVQLKAEQDASPQVTPPSYSSPWVRTTKALVYLPSSTKSPNNSRDQLNLSDALACTFVKAKATADKKDADKHATPLKAGARAAKAPQSGAVKAKGLATGKKTACFGIIAIAVAGQVAFGPTALVSDAPHPAVSLPSCPRRCITPHVPLPCQASWAALSVSPPLQCRRCDALFANTSLLLKPAPIDQLFCCRSGCALHSLAEAVCAASLPLRTHAHKPSPLCSPHRLRLPQPPASEHGRHPHTCPSRSGPTTTTRVFRHPRLHPLLRSRPPLPRPP